MADEVLVSYDDLSSFVAALFEAGGMTKTHADMVSEVLCWAEFRGDESHGADTTDHRGS